MAITNAMSKSLMSASSSMKIVRTQQGAKRQMEGKAGVLQAEIKQDGGRGAATKRKEDELEGVQEKAAKIESSQMDNISEMNANMKQAAKEDKKEQEAARAAEEKRAEKKKAKKAEEEKAVQKKAEEERIERIAEKNSSVFEGEDTVELSVEGKAAAKASETLSPAVDNAADISTENTGKTEAIGSKVDVQV